MTFDSGPLLSGPESAGLVAYVAQPSQPNEPGGRGADFGKSSPVGLVVLVLFFVAVAFLVRSMTKHLKRVPASFDEPASSDKPASADEPSADEPVSEEKK
jgi:hypothetical protein